MPTILHISHEGRSADILASEVRAIIRLPAEPSTVTKHPRSTMSTFDRDAQNPERTRVEYGGPDNGITLPISREEHEALVAAWRSAT